MRPQYASTTAYWQLTGTNDPIIILFANDWEKEVFNKVAGGIGVRSV
jgi:hypothetical protein